MSSSVQNRIESLDKAFLFAIGSSSLVFGLLQTGLGGADALLLFVPLLLVGLFIPFYIGCLRGAIVIDSVLERLRGWIYFTAGTTIYLAALVTVLLRQWSDLSLAFYLLCYTAGFVVSREWVKAIIQATSIQLSDKDLVVVGSTVGATLALVFSAFAGEEHVRFWMSAPTGSFRPEDLIIRAGSVAFLLLAFVIMERECRQIAQSSIEIKGSYDVNSMKGAAVQVMRSSQACLLKGILSDKRAFRWAALSFVAYFLLLTLSLAFSGLHVILVAVLSLLWLVTYLLAFRYYLIIPMQVPSTEEIFVLAKVNEPYSGN